MTVNNPDFINLYKTTPLPVDVSDCKQSDTSMNLVCKAKVNQNLFAANVPPNTDNSFSSKEEISLRKRKERDLDIDPPSEQNPPPQPLKKSKLFLEPYLPFYEVNPLTGSVEPRDRLSRLMQKKEAGPSVLQPNPHPTLMERNAPEPIRLDEEMPESVSLNAEVSGPVSLDEDMPEPVSSAAIPDAKGTSSYSLRKVRTPSWRVMPIVDPKPSQNEENQVAKLFKEQGIGYIADVKIDPKYQSEIANVFAGIPDDALSDETDIEGQACMRCIKAMKDDASDRYVSAIEIKEVVFSTKDGSKIIEKGVFAKKQIKKGTVIGIYAGELVPLCERSGKAKDYVFEFSEEEFSKWGIDAKEKGNFTRYINHCIEEKENVNAIGFYDGTVPRIIFIATRTIQKGEQLMYDYGDDYWERKGFKPADFS